MNIATSAIQDIDEIFRLYKCAQVFQRTKESVVVWPDFERELVYQRGLQVALFEIKIDSEV